MVEGLDLQWGQAWTCNLSTLVLLCTGIPYAVDYKEEVMGSFSSIPRGPILKESGGTEITTLPISIDFLPCVDPAKLCLGGRS